MKKAFCTFGFGGYSACLDVARPGFKEFSRKHGYDYIEGIPRSREFYRRPPAWGKVLLLRELLQVYSSVLWVDSDVLCLDDSQDIEVPEDKIQAITAHVRFKDYEIGEVPSTGFWYCSTHMLPYLNLIWTMTEYLNNAWWEQAALQELLGYAPDSQANNIPVHRIRETTLYQQTHFLPVEWNSIEYYNPKVQARFMHFPMLTVADRVKEMKECQLAMQQNTHAYAEM